MISNEPLHELQVEPAPELEADLMEVPDYFKSQAFVKRDGRHIFGIDTRDHDMLAAAGRRIQQCEHQRPPDAPPPPIRAHMHAVLGAMAVAGPGAEIAECAEPQNTRFV